MGTFEQKNRKNNLTENKKRLESKVPQPEGDG